MHSCLLAIPLLMSVPIAGATPVAHDKPVPRSVQSPDQGARAQAEKVKRLDELEAWLDKVQSSKTYEPLFKSEDPTIIRVQAEFSWAQKALHDAAARSRQGDAIGFDLADQFHNHLREYRINVDEMPPGKEFGATVVPDSATMKKLRDDLESAVERANTIPGFQEVSVAGLRPDAPACDAMTFGKRSLLEIYYLLDHRTLTFVTSQGTNAGSDLRRSLDEVSQALDRLVDENGDHIVQLGEKGVPLTDQLAPLKAALKEAAKQADFYRRGYLPNAWRDAHRRRAEQIEQRLAADGFQKALLSVKSLQAVPAKDRPAPPKR